MPDNNFCGKHDVICEKIINAERRICVMEKKLDKILYVLMSILVGVIITGVGVFAGMQ